LIVKQAFFYMFFLFVTDMIEV